MFGATERILSSSLSHSAGTRCAVRAKMAGSWAVRIPVHDEVGTASSRIIPCLELPAPAHSPQLLALRSNSGDAVKAHEYCYYRVRQPGRAGLSLKTRRTECWLCNVRATSGEA